MVVAQPFAAVIAAVKVAAGTTARTRPQVNGSAGSAEDHSEGRD